MQKEPIRILQIVPNMQSGGLENLIMNIYRNIDKTKVQFDFLVHYYDRKFFDDEIEKLGGKIYRFDLRNNNNIIKYIVELNKFYKKHKEYKIIHCHMSSIGFINFIIARHNGIKIRIAHSHNSSTDTTMKGRIKKIMMLPYKYVSTVNFACSYDAGIFLYGHKKKFEIIPNAIPFESFKYNEDYREKIRDEFKINNDEIVIGHVGRFNIQKNHEFMIKLMGYLSENEKRNYKLLLIGDGELFNKINVDVKKANLEKNVILTGVRSDVNEIYSAMDVFIMPSFFEGLPLTGIEAQISGLPCIFSDRVTRETDISSNCQYLTIDDGVKVWAKQIEITKSKNRNNILIKNKRFNIKYLAKEMQTKYLKYYNNCE